MKISVRGQPWDASTVSYRDIGFGDVTGLEMSPYVVEYGTEEFRELIEAPYAAFLESIQEDDLLTGEFDPPYLGKNGYPSWADLLRLSPQGASELIEKHLYSDLFSRSFPASEKDIRYVLNSISSVEVGAEAIVIRGQGFKAAADNS